MRWEDEQYVKVYTRDTPDFLALSYDARCLFLQLLRKVDRAGFLDLGKHGRRSVAVLLGAADLWTARVEPALAELESDGCVAVKDDTLFIPNFEKAQEARQSDKARKQAQRQRDRDAFAALHPTTETCSDIMARLSKRGVTKGPQSHEVTPGVTTSHTASHEVTLRRDETSLDETREQIPSVSAAQAIAPPTPPKGQGPLFEPPPGKPRPKPTNAQAAFVAWMAEARGKAVLSAPPDMKPNWGQHGPELARALGDHGRKLLESAYLLFLADSYARARNPPCPLGLFVAQWPKWVSEAQRAQGAADKRPSVLDGKWEPSRAEVANAG